MTTVAIMLLSSASRKVIVTSFQPIIQKHAWRIRPTRFRFPINTHIFSTLSQSDILALENEIKQQGDLIRQLKADGVDKATLAPHIEKLMSLKARLPPKDEPPTLAPSPPPSAASAAAAVPPTKKQQQASSGDESQMSESEIRKTRLSKVQAMRDAGVQPFEYRYQPTHTAGQLQTLFQGRLDLGEEDVAFGDVSVAGRIMIKRVFGKLAFFTMQDESGTIQLQLEKNRLGESFDVRV